MALMGLDRDGSYVLHFLYVSHSNSAISFKSGKYMRFDDKISEKENRGCRNLQPLLLDDYSSALAIASWKSLVSVKISCL